MAPQTQHRVRARAAAGTVFVATVLASTSFAATPLSRDLRDYFAFGLKDIGLKNITVLGACNAGVNCAQPNPNSSCGVANHENAHYGEGSQIAADRAKFNRPGAEVWQLFSNEVTTLANVTVDSPPIEALTPMPILADADGDGIKSCDTSSGQCVTDAGDLAAACGFPKPFPTCDVAKEVLAQPGEDCSRGPDAVPATRAAISRRARTARCPCRRRRRLTLQGWAYTFCEVAVSQTAEVIADATTTIDVTGDVRINNDASFGPPPGQDCGASRCGRTDPAPSRSAAR
jgi:hypothetical protein